MNELNNLKNDELTLEIVVELYNEIWIDFKKCNENYQKIKQLLNELLSIYPNDTRALTNLGAILSDTGRYEEALIILLKAENIGSKDANLYQNIGIVKMNIESERNNAMVYFEKASKLKPDKLTIVAYFDIHGY